MAEAPLFDHEIWSTVKPEHLWVYDKLIVASICGYACGPRGVPVPKPDNYIIRPIVNTEGMGQGAYIAHLDYGTLHIPHGFFWCEVLHGDHLSVDYLDGEPVLSVIGTKDEEHPLQRFTYWKKLSDTIPLPEILHPLASNYRHINCEFIGGRLIEVHLRHNPDFSHGNTEMIPLWRDRPATCPDGFRFIADDAGFEDQRAGICVR